MLVADARQAVADDASPERIQSLTSELQEIRQALLARQPGDQQVGASVGGGGGSSADEDVIDADFDRG
jgi:molecular chaperone DnaK